MCSFSALIILCGFLFLNIGHSISSGVSHADDAYMAIGSKNLAYGFGYGTSLTPDGSAGFVKFPAGYTTGPALVLPVAAMIALFGNQPWVPGLTTLIINAILIFLLFFIVFKSNLSTSPAGWLIVWLLMLYSLTAGRFFEHWNSMLGEMPAALLSILGVFLVSVPNQHRSRYLIAGLAFGLAFMAKMVSLLGFLPVIIWLTVLILRAGNHRKEHHKNLFRVLTAFLIPVLCFDLYKLTILGFDGYLQSYRQFFAAFSEWHDPLTGSDGGEGYSLFTILIKRFESFGSSLGFSVAALFLSLIIAGIVIFRKNRNGIVQWAFGLLSSGFLLHFLWWSMLSSGRIRYLLIGLILAFTALSVVILADFPMLIRLLFIGLFFLVTLNSGVNLLKPVAFVTKHQFRYIRPVKCMLSTVDYLEKSKPGTTMAYVWWAEVADLDYGLSMPGRFVRIDHLSVKDFQQDIILVRNKKWEISYFNQLFSNRISLFKEVLAEDGPYRILRFSNPDSVLLHQIIKR